MTDDITRAAEALLRQNRVTPTWNGRTYRYTRPAPSTYEQQWLWDSCFHAIALRWLDPAMAWDELDAVVAHAYTEGPDAGMLPHMTYWDGGAEALWGNPTRSIITQPPLVAIAAIAVAERVPAAEAGLHLQALYSAICAFHEWMDRRRDPDGGAQQFVTLFGGCATPDQARAMAGRIETALGRTPYVLSILPPEHPAFDPTRYWRSNVSVQVNWMVWMGLRRYGFSDLAAELAARTIALVAESGPYKYYNPLTGQGHGSHPHSWAALTMDMARSD